MNPDLSQLRDIHLPPPVSWWPPAPGWWLLLGATAAVAIGLLWWFRRRRNNRWRRQALRELADLRGRSSGAQGVIALSVLLRRVALNRFPRHEVAALNGEAWLAFLDRTFGTDNAFTSDSGRLLATAPYAQNTQIEPQAMLALFDLSERWIRKLPGGAAK